MPAPSRQSYLYRLRLLRECAGKGMAADEAARAAGIVVGTLRKTLAAIQADAVWPLPDDVMAAAIAKQEAFIAQMGGPLGAWGPTTRQRNVIALAEQVFDLLPGVTLTGSRSRMVVRARQAAVLVLTRNWPGISTAQIGVTLDVDHSSVVTARQRAEAMEVAEPVFGCQVHELDQLVRAQQRPDVAPAPPEQPAARPRHITRSAALVERTAAERNRQLLGGLFGTRGGRGMGSETLPEDAVLTAQALRDGSDALLAAIRREHPQRVAA